MDTDQTPNKDTTNGTDTGSTIANTGGRNMDTRHDNETRTLSGARIQVTAIGQTRYERSGNVTDSFRMVVGIDLLTGDPVGGVPVAETDLIDIARNLGYDVTGFIATDDADMTARDGADAGTPRLDDDGAGDDATAAGGDEAEHVAGAYDDVLESDYSRTTIGYEHWLDDMQFHNGCELAIGHISGDDTNPSYHAAVVDCVDHECVVAVIGEWNAARLTATKAQK